LALYKKIKKKSLKKKKKKKREEERWLGRSGWGGSATPNGQILYKKF
jgi:hypothetical protein